MSKSESIVLGGGCFWCLDAIYRMVRGVTAVTAGYAGGAEVVEVVFDPEEVTLKDILEIFFFAHDPTTLNRQGNDVGEQYRSVIFYSSEAQKEAAEAAAGGFAKTLWDEPVITQIAPLAKFWPAEEYHQDFFHKNPAQAYCQVVINPKLSKFKERYQELLKH